MTEPRRERANTRRSSRGLPGELASALLKLEDNEREEHRRQTEAQQLQEFNLIRVDRENALRLVMTWEWSRTGYGMLGFKDHDPKIWNNITGLQFPLIVCMVGIFVHIGICIWVDSPYTLFLLILVPPANLMYALAKDVNFIRALFLARDILFTWLTVIIALVLSIALVHRFNKMVEMVILLLSMFVTTLRDALPPHVRHSNGNGRQFTASVALIMFLEYLSILFNLFEVTDIEVSIDVVPEYTYNYSTRQLLADSLGVLTLLATKQAIIEWMNIGNAKLLMLSHEVYCVDPKDPNLKPNKAKQRDEDNTQLESDKDIDDDSVTIDAAKQLGNPSNPEFLV